MSLANDVLLLLYYRKYFDIITILVNKLIFHIQAFLMHAII